MAGRAMIVAGFGFRSAAAPESLLDAFTRSGGPGRALVAATAADKAQTDVFQAFAASASLDTHAISVAALVEQQTLTQSQASAAVRGTGSVAEAAALAAAGAGARLLGPRAISSDGMATCALAEGNGT